MRPRSRFASLMVLALTAALSAVPGAAQDPKSLACTFSTGVTHVYEANRFNTEKAAPLAFGITAIDVAAQTADLKTESGTGSLRVVQAVNALHFLEVAIEGALYITTVFDKDDSNGTYPAVHSRHSSLLGEPIVTNYQGYCRETE